MSIDEWLISHFIVMKSRNHQPKETPDYFALGRNNQLSSQPLNRPLKRVLPNTVNQLRIAIGENSIDENYCNEIYGGSLKIYNEKPS